MRALLLGPGGRAAGRRVARARRALLGALVLAFVAGQAMGAAHTHPRASTQVSALCGVCLLAAQVADRAGDPPALVHSLPVALELPSDAEAPCPHAVLPTRVSRAPPAPTLPLQNG